MSANLPQLFLEAGFGSTPATAPGSITWTDLVPYGVLSISFDRGRQYELDTVQPSSLTALLFNSDGRYSPTNGSSPYAGQVLPMVPLRLRMIPPGGSVVTLWQGYAERWTQTYPDGGNAGYIELEGIDALAVLALTTLRTVVQQEILKSAPTVYYPMNDGSSAASPTEVTRNLPLLPMQAVPTGNPGAAKWSLGGSPVAIGGGGGSVTFSGNELYNPGSPGSGNDNGYVLLPDSTLILDCSAAWTISCGFQVPPFDVSGANYYGGILLGTIDPSAGSGKLTVWIGATGYSDFPQVFFRNSANTQSPSINAHDVSGNAPHHVAVTWDPAAGAHGTLSLYQDGSLVGTAGPTVSGSMGATKLRLVIGGDDPYPTLNAARGQFQGSISDLAIWQGTALSAGTIQTHANALITGFANELLSARASRLLGYLPQQPTAVVGTSSSSIGLADFDGNTALDALQTLAQWENGNCWIDRQGNLQWAGRTARYNLTASYVLGENTGSGEIPYDDMSFDFDPTYIYNDVTIQRANGGFGYAADATSKTQYGLRVPPAITYGTNSDNDVQAAAEYKKYRYAQPLQRVKTLTVTPKATAVWAAVALIDIGVRVTTNRRPVGAPLISDDFIIEKVGFSWTGETGVCAFTFEASPADTTTYWKLDDSTLSVLGTSTRLAY